MLRNLIAFGLIATLGCGTSASPVGMVHGKVQHRGQPLKGGLIVFTPDEDKGARGALAMATIEDDGTYTLRRDGQPGAATGWHKVSIAPAAGTKTTLSGDYRSPATSGLEREIQAGEENVFDFDLE